MGYFHLTYCTMCTKWLKVRKWHAAVVDTRGFGIKQDFIPLFFFMYLYILWQGQKAVVTIVEFEFVDIFYSKFQLVSTFSTCSKFCVENWLLRCDLSCKWVTCRSGCKRFWKQALHIWMFLYAFISVCVNGKNLNTPTRALRLMAPLHRQYHRSHNLHHLYPGMGPGGYSDLSWTGVCRSSLKTHTHL